MQQKQQIIRYNVHNAEMSCREIATQFHVIHIVINRLVRKHAQHDNVSDR